MTLEGRDGREVPAKLTLIRDGRGWRVLAMTGFGRDHIGTGAWLRYTLADSEALSLVQGTVAEFSESI